MKERADVHTCRISAPLLSHFAMANTTIIAQLRRCDLGQNGSCTNPPYRSCDHTDYCHARTSGGIVSGREEVAIASEQEEDTIQSFRGPLTPQFKGLVWTTAPGGSKVDIELRVGYWKLL
jgi:hypothetical protein